jgi:hypothetical protein
LWAKINTVNKNVSPENQHVNFAINGHDLINR